MKNRNFCVSEDGGRLLLKKQPQPAIHKAMMCSGAALCVGWGAWQFIGVPALSGQTPLDFRLLFVPFAMGWCLAAASEIRVAWRTIKGEVWIFDLHRQRLERSGLVQCLLSEITSVQIVEADVLCHQLLVIPAQGKPIYLEDNADGQLDELVEVAQKIADFTGLKVIRVQSRN